MTCWVDDEDDEEGQLDGALNGGAWGRSATGIGATELLSCSSFSTSAVLAAPLFAGALRSFFSLTGLGVELSPSLSAFPPLRFLSFGGSAVARVDPGRGLSDSLNRCCSYAGGGGCTGGAAVLPVVAGVKAGAPLPLLEGMSGVAL